MKFLLVALLAMSTFSSYALETVKVSDGKAAYCKTKHDTFRSRFGAYKISAQSVGVADGIVKIETNFKFMTCIADGEDFSWVQISPLEELRFQTPLPTDSREITVITNSATLKLMRDGVYKTLDEVELTDDTATPELQFELDRFLTDSEKEAFEAGELVKINTDIFMIKNITLEGLSMEYQSNKGFGAFRFRFSVQKNDDGSVTSKKL